MRKTTVYLPDDLKVALEREAASTGRSEAEVIREAIAAHTNSRVKPLPRFPLFESADPISERVDELLAGGFGLD